MISGTQQNKKHSVRKWANLAVLLVFLGLVSWLLYGRLKTIDVNKLYSTLLNLNSSQLIPATLGTALSYALFVSYALLAKRFLKHEISYRRTSVISFVSYAFNLSLGGIIGAVGFRIRLYSRWGLKKAQIAQVMAFVIVSNWLGYFLLSGLWLLIMGFPTELSWQPPDLLANVIAVGILFVPIIYVAMAYHGRGKSYWIRGLEWKFPNKKTSLVQITLAVLNWLMIAFVIWSLFPVEVSYSTILVLYLASGLAGAMSHIPAGLGVIEAVFLTGLHDSVGQEAILASLLAFRAVYYLIPLIFAIPTYLTLEWKAHKRLKIGT